MADGGSIFNHPIMTGLIVAISTVIGGFILYKFIPWIYEVIKESHDLRFYHSIILPVEQNKQGVVNTLKFLSGKSMTENSGLRSRVNVDGVSYNIAVNKHIHFNDSTSGTEYEYRAKVNVDPKGNIGNVVLSTYKRKLSGFIDEDRINAFDAFVTTLSPANITVLVHGSASAPASMATVATTSPSKPLIPSGTTAQMNNMAAATTAVVAGDFD